eukprot:365310-Chlamydomonas_euryale.AAC.8
MASVGVCRKGGRECRRGGRNGRPFLLRTTLSTRRALQLYNFTAPVHLQHSAMRACARALRCPRQHTAAATSKQSYQRWYGYLLAAAAVCWQPPRTCRAVHGMPPCVHRRPHSAPAHLDARGQASAARNDEVAHIPEVPPHHRERYVLHKLRETEAACGAQQPRLDVSARAAVKAWKAQETCQPAQRSVQIWM